jgi:hypothetical protein
MAQVQVCEASIKAFAEQHRLKVKTDSCGDSFIAGKTFCPDMVTVVKRRIAKGIKRDLKEYSSHIYDGFADGRLGLCLLYATKKRWNAAQKLMLAAGFIGRQFGDTEGCFTFDPENPAQVTLALSLARIKRKRIPSPSQAAVLARLNDRLAFAEPA